MRSSERIGQAHQWFVFEPIEGDGRTFAELTTEEKNGVSHRARALRALAELLHQ